MSVIGKVLKTLTITDKVLNTFFEVFQLCVRPIFFKGWVIGFTSMWGGWQMTRRSGLLEYAFMHYYDSAAAIAWIFNDTLGFHHTMPACHFIYISVICFHFCAIKITNRATNESSPVWTVGAFSSHCICVELCGQFHEPWIGCETPVLCFQVTTRWLKALYLQWTTATANRAWCRPDTGTPWPGWHCRALIG